MTKLDWQDVHVQLDDNDGEWTCRMQIPDTGWLYRHTELVTIHGVAHLTSCMVFVPLHVEVKTDSPTRSGPDLETIAMLLPKPDGH